MIKNFRKKRGVFWTIILGTFLIISVTLAGTPFLELSWPPSPATRILLTPTTPLPLLVQYFYEWGIALGGLAAFISLVIGGFQYLTSMGEPARLAEAKDRIRSAFFGLILLLGSWLILNTINPQLTTLRLPPQPFGAAGQLECDLNSDCPSGYQCSDQHQGDGRKEGVCIKGREEGPTCTKAQVTYSGNNTILVEIGQTVVAENPTEVVTFCRVGNQEKSCCDQEAIKNGYYGGGCYLQLFGNKQWWEIWRMCGDLEAVVPGCETRIAHYTDKPIQCVRLISATSSSQ
jgi:hypothetical protein